MFWTEVSAARFWGHQRLATWFAVPAEERAIMVAFMTAKSDVDAISQHDYSKWRERNKELFN